LKRQIAMSPHPTRFDVVVFTALQKTSSVLKLYLRSWHLQVVPTRE